MDKCHIGRLARVYGFYGDHEELLKSSVYAVGGGCSTFIGKINCFFFTGLGSRRSSVCVCVFWTKLLGDVARTCLMCPLPSKS